MGMSGISVSPTFRGKTGRVEGVEAGASLHHKDTTLSSSLQAPPPPVSGLLRSKAVCSSRFCINTHGVDGGCLARLGRTDITRSHFPHRPDRHSCTRPPARESGKGWWGLGRDADGRTTPRDGWKEPALRCQGQALSALRARRTDAEGHIGVMGQQKGGVGVWGRTFFRIESGTPGLASTVAITPSAVRGFGLGC